MTENEANAHVDTFNEPSIAALLDVFRQTAYLGVNARCHPGAESDRIQ